ncbi:hypothetical protein, partial [Escherichia coli]|uniref:hypothetical protein n=1 Tax=Escherichia coli TaxID=562 RepID=UPI00215B4533
IQNVNQIEQTGKKDKNKQKLTLIHSVWRSNLAPCSRFRRESENKKQKMCYSRENKTQFFF